MNINEDIRDPRPITTGKIILAVFYIVLAIVTAYFFNNSPQLQKAQSPLKLIKSSAIIPGVVAISNFGFFWKKKPYFIKNLVGLIGVLTAAVFLTFQSKLPTPLESSTVFQLTIGFIFLFLSLNNCAESITISFSLPKTGVHVLVVAVLYDLAKCDMMLGKNMDKPIYIIINLLVFSFFSVAKLIRDDVSIEQIRDLLQKVRSNWSEVFCDVMLYGVPYCLFRRTGAKTAAILILIFIIDSIRKRKQVKKEQKVLMLIVLVTFLYQALNFIAFRFLMHYKIEVRTSFLAIFSLIFVCYRIDREKVENCLFIGAISSISLTMPSVLIWISKNYAYSRHADGSPATIGKLLGLLAIIFLFSIIFLKYKKFFPIAVVTILALILSGTRSGILVCTGMIPILLLFQVLSDKRLSQESLCTVGLILLLFFMMPEGLKKRIMTSSNDASALSRLYTTRNAIEQYKKSPVFGNGVQTYTQLDKYYAYIKSPKTVDDHAKNGAYVTFHGHNNIAETLRSYGIVGLILHIVLEGYLLIFFFLRWWKKKEKLALLPIFMTIAVEGIGLADVTTIAGSSTQWLYYFLSGSIFTAILSDKSEPKIDSVTE